MTKEKRDRIRREKTRLQKARVAWKRAHPVEAQEKAIEDLLGQERRALRRRDLALAKKLKVEIKHDRWLLRRAEKDRRGPLVAAPKKQKPQSFLGAIATSLKAKFQKMLNVRRRPVLPNKAF